MAGQADVSVDQPKRAFDGAVRAAFGAIHPGLPGAADHANARVSARRQIIGAPLVPGEHEPFQSCAEFLRGATSGLQVGAKLVGGLARRETVWVPTSCQGIARCAGSAMRIVESILPFIRSDAVHVIIGREIVVAVAGLQRR